MIVDIAGVLHLTTDPFGGSPMCHAPMAQPRLLAWPSRLANCVTCLALSLARPTLFPWSRAVASMERAEACWYRSAILTFEGANRGLITYGRVWYDGGAQRWCWTGSLDENGPRSALPLSVSADSPRMAFRLADEDLLRRGFTLDPGEPTDDELWPFVGEAPGRSADDVDATLPTGWVAEARAEAARLLGEATSKPVLHELANGTVKEHPAIESIDPTTLFGTLTNQAHAAIAALDRAGIPRADYCGPALTMAERVDRLHLAYTVRAAQVEELRTTAAATPGAEDLALVPPTPLEQRGSHRPPDTMRLPTGTLDDEVVDAEQSRVVKDGSKVRFWTYYPQMGGYHGKAVVTFDLTTNCTDDVSGCFDASVFHDGDFPFDEAGGRSPARIHHCSAEQFVDFGLQVIEAQVRHQLAEHGGLVRISDGWIDATISRLTRLRENLP